MRQIDATRSPRFTQISTFGRLPVEKNLDGVKGVFIGIPFDDATSYRPGERFGPMGIRQGSRLLRPYNPFVDAYPFEDLNACDYGDINIIPGYTEDTMEVITKEYLSIASKTVPFAAGGDHSIALPILRAMHQIHGRVNLVHLDSHYDFWNTYWGDKRYTHGTWLRRAREEGLLNDVVQVGIRASLYSKADIDDAKKLNVTYYTTNDVKRAVEKVIKHVNSLKGKTYISLDIDVTDPAFAPGTGTPEVGGLTSFELIDILRSFKVELAGMEVVEVAPAYDVSEITSMLAANAIYETMSTLSRTLK